MAFVILTIASLILECLLGNTPVNDNSPKVSGYLSLFLFCGEAQNYKMDNSVIPFLIKPFPQTS